ncbi:hypothetical protein FIJ20_19545 [Escherichia coli]|uniref:Uncharacterized protein n=1 Tax=Escherichia coli TaxID=562 RepID=A0A8S7CSE6_ECOLX|nr:hypothetical protein [Escherichia coli]HAH0329925.1 hypothetical protein [Escherichia coli]
MFCHPETTATLLRRLLFHRRVKNSLSFIRILLICRTEFDEKKSNNKEQQVEKAHHLYRFSLRHRGGKPVFCAILRP